jgi:hypothetical protein
MLKMTMLSSSGSDRGKDARGPPPTMRMRSGVCFDAALASDDTDRVDMEKLYYPQ